MRYHQDGMSAITALLLLLCVSNKTIDVVSFTIHDGSTITKRSLLHYHYSVQSEKKKYSAALFAATSSNYNGKEQQTLYGILGASHNDSRTKIKQKYNDLARELHPDAQIGKAISTISDIEFTDINEAWQILGNEEKRKQYDRKLKAQEFGKFAKDFGKLFEVGFRTAVPIITQTANTTIKVMEAAVVESSKVMNIYDLERESRGLEQQAVLRMARVKKLNKKLKNAPNKRLAMLKVDSDSKLTAAEANKIEEEFGGNDVLPLNSKDIQELETMENDHQNLIKNCSKFEKLARLAEKQAEIAMKEEEVAAQKLEEAQKFLLIAKQKTASTQKEKFEAIRQEKSLSKGLNKTISIIKTLSEKVRSSLRKKEENSMKKNKKDMIKECADLEILAKQFQDDAQQLKKEADSRKLAEAVLKKLKSAERKMAAAAAKKR